MTYLTIVKDKFLIQHFLPLNTFTSVEKLDVFQ